MHLGAHEDWVKKCPVSLKIQEGMPSIAAEGAAKPRRTHSTRAHCPQCFTACRLDLLPAQEAGVGLVVTQGTGTHASRGHLILVDEGWSLIWGVVNPEILTG